MLDELVVLRKRLADRDERRRFGEPINVRDLPSELALKTLDGGRRRRRAPMIVLGTGLIIGGALAAVHALVDGGPLTGSALEISAAVGTSAPLT